MECRARHGVPYESSRNHAPEAGLFFGREAILPWRNSSPVSRKARSSAGQSSKWVAKIFSTMRCVNSGTRRLKHYGRITAFVRQARPVQVVGIPATQPASGWSNP